MPDLTPFESRDVASIAIIVRNTGDGLSEAVAVDPIELALECEVEKIRFDPIKDTEDLRRVQILKAGAATFIDNKAVDKALAEQVKRIEAGKGVQRLPMGDEEGDDEGDGSFDPSQHPAPAALSSVRP